MAKVQAGLKRDALNKVSRIFQILPSLSTQPVNRDAVEYDPLKNLKPDVTYKLGVCGVPMTRLEYYSRREQLSDFLEQHSIKVRFVLDQIATLTAENIDEMVFNSSHPLMSPSIRAECAFNVLAWHTFFDPFAHPKRKHFFKKDFLLPILELSAESYYKWAVYVHQQPNTQTFNKMRTLHPQVVEHYHEYCANMMIEQREGVDASWLTTW